MRSRLLTGLVLTSVLAACQTPVTQGPRTTPAAATPAPKASNEPAATPGAQPVASPARANFLVVKEGAKVLSGRVQIDPEYVVQVGRGKLIANDGASVLAAASVLSNDGSGLISQDGGGLVAQGGGNVVAPATLIAQDGAGLVAQGGGNFTLLQASQPPIWLSPEPYCGTPGYMPGDAPSPLPSGEDEDLVPAAGMVVGLRSQGKLVPIGSDAAGQPVYAAYSNLRGEYRFELNGDLPSTVEVVALAPGQADARLQYSLLTPSESSGVVQIDDDTSAVSSYLNEVIFSYMLTVVRGDAELIKKWSGFNSEISFKVQDALLALIASAPPTGPASWCEGDQRWLAAQLTTKVLGEVNIKGTLPLRDLVPEAYRNHYGESETALAILAQEFGTTRRFLAKRFDEERALNCDPARIFSNLQIVKEANERDHTVYEIKRPSDHGMFVAKAIIGRFGGDTQAILSNVIRFNLETRQEGTPDGLAWLQACMEGFQNAVGTSMAALLLVDDADHAQLMKKYLHGEIRPPRSLCAQ